MTPIFFRGHRYAGVEDMPPGIRLEWEERGRWRESRWQRWVRYNFWLSVLALTAMVVWSYVHLAITGELIAPMAIADPHMFVPASTSSGGGAYVLLEIAAAWFFYRRGGTIARGAAAFVGLFLIAALFVVVGSVPPGTAPNGLVVVVLLYASGSHLLYAIAGSRVRYG